MTNDNDWTPTSEQLIRLWNRQCSINAIDFERNSQHLKWLYYLIGYPAAILSAFSATTLFITYSNPCETSPNVILGMGILGAIGAVSQAVLIFGEYNVRSKNSHDTSSDYFGLSREGELVLSIERKGARENAVVFTRGYKEAYDKIYDSASTLMSRRPADNLPQISVMESYVVENKQIEQMEQIEHGDNVSGAYTSNQGEHVSVELPRVHMPEAERELMRRIAAQTKRLGEF